MLCFHDFFRCYSAAIQCYCQYHTSLDRDMPSDYVRKECQQFLFLFHTTSDYSVVDIFYFFGGKLVCYRFVVMYYYLPGSLHYIFWWIHFSYTLQMFCLLNPQMNACEPNPKTTCSDFNSWKSVTKIFCFHAISTGICLLFKGSFVLLIIFLKNNSAVFTPFYL